MNINIFLIDKLIDRKKEFYDKANSVGREEVTKFAKELIKKQSNT